LHIEANPNFIRPANRRNEVIKFIEQGLRDICITRRNPGWGIPVPDRPDLVIYVWFDALINYIASTGWPDAQDWETKWPAKVQWVGKDILTRFHATLWPAMLMGAGLPIFETVVAHGWVLLGEGKMSKSKGNVVRPLELADALAERAGIPQSIAIDAVRHYLTATMSLENDSQFTYEEFDLRFNADLANDLGNALNRSLSMAHKFGFDRVPDAEPEPEVIRAISDAKSRFESAMSDYQIASASSAAFGLIRFLGKYIDQRAPWALAKNEDPALAAVVVGMLRVVRAAEGLLQPMMPVATSAVAEQLGVPPTAHWANIGTPESLPVGTELRQPQPIFPRLEIEKKVHEPKGEVPKEKPEPNPQKAMDEKSSEITIDDFAKVKFRVARILEAENIEDADRLYKLQVMIGEEKRQIVSGIRNNYTPEDLIGRQIVVVTNLKPAKLRGVESNGMLLAATDENGGAILLQPDKEAPEGAPVK
jgi:methionyl-tRNA synthetase